jgi:hypothetical protein
MKSILRITVTLALFVAFLGCSDEVTAPSQDGGGFGPSLVDKSGGQGGVSIIPANARPHGHSYSEWVVSWWQWMVSAPVPENPGLDETGEFIDWGQSGKVWFLAPNFGGAVERWGTVPKGTMLFVALMTWSSSELEGYGSTEEELAAFSAMIIDGIENLVCEIDGVPVENLEAFRVTSGGLYEFTIPEDNVYQASGFDAPAGTYYPAFADGYFLMLPPLAPGEHTLHWSGELPMLDFWQDITVHLTVDAGP